MNFGYLDGYMIFEIKVQINVIWIIYVLLSVFTTNLRNLDRLDHLCVIIWLWEKQWFCVIWIVYVRLC